MNSHDNLFDFNDYKARQTSQTLWDEQWGGPCPWRASDPEFEELRRKAGIVDEDVWGKDKPWIDKAMPWILVWGGLALLIGLYGILHWFLFTVVPGVM